MARTFNGTSDTIKGTIASNLGGSFTFACWMKTGSSIKDGGLIQSRVAILNNYWAYLYTQASGLNRVSFSLYDGSFNPTVRSANSSITTNTVYHCAGVRNTTADTINVYLNGTGVTAVNDTTTSLPTYSDFNVGHIKRTVDEEFWNGDIWDVAVWSVALTVAEILALAQGASPNMIRRGSLIYYTPLHGLSSPEVDISGTGVSMTVTGTTVTSLGRSGRYVPTKRFYELPPAESCGTLVTEDIDEIFTEDGQSIILEGCTASTVGQRIPVFYNPKILNYQEISEEESII